MKIYGGIGSRKLSADEWNLCFVLGKYLAERGWVLKTGAAEGADQAFAQGALSVGGVVILCLPWYSYNRKWVEWAVSVGAQVVVLKDADMEAHSSVHKYHPKPDKLKSGSKMLHARNWLIVSGAALVLAWPKPNRYGALGGTGQGIRICEGENIPLFNLNNPNVLKTVATDLERYNNV